MKTDVWNPIATVQIRGEAIQVKELDWRTYLWAVKELTGTLMGLVNDKGQLILEKDKIVTALTDQENLVSVLVEKSTGRDAAWVSSLSARELFIVVKPIVELNLSEEVLSPGKELAGRMRAVFASKTASLASSTT